MRIAPRLTGITFLIASVVLLGSGTSILAAEKATLRLIPNANIRNGQVVRLTGSGFPPAVELEFAMCDSRVSGKYACILEDSIFTNKNGSFTTRLKLLSGLGPTPSCGMTTSTLNSCYIGATTQVTGADRTTVIIHFALNKVNGIANAAAG